MGRCLAMYDLSGIQSFIFQTNRLKEIVGASHLVTQALFGNAPELLGEERDAWKSRTIDEFISVASSRGKIVYIGGGNALVLFGSEEQAIEFTKKLKCKVFEQTGGALRICSALCTVDDDTRLSDCLNPGAPNSLRNKLDCSKAKAPQALTARGFSIDALQNETGEPILFFEETLVDRAEKNQFLGRSQFLKLKAYKDQRDTTKKPPAHSPHFDSRESREYKDSFEEFFEDNGVAKEGKRYLAVIHIDGNTMGQRIANYLTDAKAHCKTFEEDLIAMRNLSAFIGDLYENALSQMEDKLYSGVEGPLPFRRVVADGDDITYICRSEKALQSVSVFVEALRNPQIDVRNREHLPAAKELSIGAGIALVNNSYPFSSAYAMAEELCKNAKKAARERFGNDPKSPVSSVDFHVCSGEVVTNIGDFRRRYLRQYALGAGNPVDLCIRPYHIGDANVIEPPILRFDSFLQQLNELQKHSADDVETESKAWIARSKLKGLYDKYGEGEQYAVRYGEFIVERDVAMLLSDVETTQERKDFVAKFKEEPYVTINTGSHCEQQHARFFDALDVMDLCDGMGDAE